MAILRQVEKRTINFASGQTSQTITLNTTLLDTAKAACFLTYRNGANAPAQNHFSTRIISTTQLTVERDAAGTGSTAEIVIYIAEWLSGVSVQRGSTVIGTGPGDIIDVTLSALDLAKSWIEFNYRIEGSFFGQDDMVLARLWDDAGTKKLRLQINGSVVSTGTVEWQVIEHNACTVQRFLNSMTSGQASITQAISAIDQTKTIVKASRRAGNGTAANIAEKMLRARFTSDTEVTIDRGSTGVAIDEISLEIIAFSDGTRVEAVLEDFAAADGQNDTAIMSVNNAIAILSGQHGSMGRCDRTTDDVPGEAYFTADLTSPTNLQTRRAATADAASGQVFVIDFPVGVGYTPHILGAGLI